MVRIIAHSLLLVVVGGARVHAARIVQEEEEGSSSVLGTEAGGREETDARHHWVHTTEVPELDGASLAESLASRSGLPKSYCKRKERNASHTNASLDEATMGKAGRGDAVDCCDDNVDPDKAWEAVHARTCYPLSIRAKCSGNTIAECKAECAADKGCGGFTWPHGHMKDMNCYQNMEPEINTLFLRKDTPKKAATGTVYVIRHGEKNKEGCLSPAGHDRARALVDMFNGKPSDWHETLDTPKALFAHRYVNSCERTNQTLQPISKALNLVVNTEHGGDKDSSPGVGGGNQGGADAVKEALIAGHNPVLVAWESMNMPYFIKALGTFEFPIYPQGSFDRLYIVELTDGVVTCFHETWQHDPARHAATTTTTTKKATTTS